MGKEEDFWHKGSYVESIDIDEPVLKEKMKYFSDDKNMPKEDNCKQCNEKIGKHNVYWHEGFCDECFFEKYFS